ncbi:MAG: hypothetical protein QM736_29605 [Vicinamibacterales bacterium]
MLFWSWDRIRRPDAAGAIIRADTSQLRDRWLTTFHVRDEAIETSLHDDRWIPNTHTDHMKAPPSDVDEGVSNGIRAAPDGLLGAGRGDAFTSTATVSTPAMRAPPHGTPSGPGSTG